MHPLFEIETPRLLLRKLLPEDENGIFEILSDEQTCLDDGGFHAFTTKDDSFYKCLTYMQKQKRYAIILKQEQKCIGLLNLQEEQRAVQAYELGFVLNTNYRRHGYMFEAVSNLISTYFEQTDVEMFTAGHFPNNQASCALIQKLGFTYEGISHKALTHAVYGPVDIVYYYKEKNC